MQSDPVLYTLTRIETEEKGRFFHERFAFCTCVKGQGETVLVPEHTGWLDLQGKMDLFMASYRNKPDRQIAPGSRT